MKVVIQRVTKASVATSSDASRSIQKGLVLLVGFDLCDTAEIVSSVIKKVANLRIFNDAHDRLNLSVRDVHGEILLVPNFTLSSSLRRGNRPSFDSVLAPDTAQILFEHAAACFSQYQLHVVSGFFGQHMSVTLVNDGPITLMVDSKEYIKF